MNIVGHIYVIQSMFSVFPSSHHKTLEGAEKRAAELNKEYKTDPYFVVVAELYE
jgi:hypothetical protein